MTSPVDARVERRGEAGWVDAGAAAEAQTGRSEFAKEEVARRANGRDVAGIGEQKHQGWKRKKKKKGKRGLIQAVVRSSPRKGRTGKNQEPEDEGSPSSEEISDVVKKSVVSFNKKKTLKVETTADPTYESTEVSPTSSTSTGAEDLASVDVELKEDENVQPKRVQFAAENQVSPIRKEPADLFCPEVIVSSGDLEQKNGITASNLQTPDQPQSSAKFGRSMQSSLLKGWIRVSYSPNGEWRTRWAVVHHNILYMFPSEQASRPSSIYVLDGIVIDSKPRRCEPGVFKIVTRASRTMYLHTETETSRSKWISHLRSQSYERQLQKRHELEEKKKRRANKLAMRHVMRPRPRFKPIVSFASISTTMQELFWAFFAMLQIFLLATVKIFQVVQGQPDLGVDRNGNPNSPPATSTAARRRRPTSPLNCQ